MTLKSRLAALAALASLSALAACATPSQSVQMTSPVTVNIAVSDGDVGYRSVTAVNVTGGRDTNPLWTSQVSNEAFKTALEETLGAAGNMGAEGRQMTVSAALAKLEQPLFGLDMSVTSHVRYIVSQQGWTVFDETVTATGSAGLGDNLLGVERLRTANEASVKENIRQFLVRMRVHALTH